MVDKFLVGHRGLTCTINVHRHRIHQRSLGKLGLLIMTEFVWLVVMRVWMRLCERSWGTSVGVRSRLMLEVLLFALVDCAHLVSVGVLGSNYMSVCG